MLSVIFFFFSSRRRHTRFDCDWSSDVCSSDLRNLAVLAEHRHEEVLGLGLASVRKPALDAQPVHLPPVRRLGLADDGYVVLRDAGHQAGAAANARVDIHRHAPAIAGIALTRV